MKKLYTIFAGMIIFIAACKKDAPVYMASSNINVVNAAIDAGPVKVNPAADASFNYFKAPEVAYGANAFFGSNVGPRSITVVSAADTTKKIYSATLSLQPINTLYLVGQWPNVEGLFVEEKDIPMVKFYGSNPDNSLYVRFVNLSPNSGPVSINLKTTPATTANEVTALPYKGVSEFKKYAALRAIPAIGTTPAVPATPNYVFEIRNSTTNAVITTFTLETNPNRFKTISLVLRGFLVSPPATTTPAPFGVLQVNYF